MIYGARPAVPRRHQMSRPRVVVPARAVPGVEPRFYTSFADRLIIWLHVAFVIFTIGPVTIAILSSPRYIRTRNVAVLRYMLRTTRIFGTASLGVLAFGIAAAQSLHKLNAAWITAALTLFVVSLVLLVIIMRDQRKAIVALETAAEHEALTTANAPPAPPGTARAGGPAGCPRRAGDPRHPDSHHRCVGGAGPHRLTGRHRHADLAGRPGPDDLELLATHPRFWHLSHQRQVLPQPTGAERPRDEVARPSGHRGVPGVAPPG